MMPGPLTYQKENLSELRPELEQLLPGHWKEMARDQDYVPLNVAWAKYYALEAIGAIHMITARDRGELVGYHLTIVTPHLHSEDVLHGLVDYLYLLPEYRQGRNGINLIKFAEQDMISLGVKKIVTGVKLHHDHGIILKRMGYEPSDMIYTKVII